MALYTDFGVPTLGTIVKNLQVAPVVKNDATDFTAGKAVPVLGVNSVSSTQNSSTKTYQGDGGVYAQETTVTDTTLTINVPGATPQFREQVLGWKRRGATLIESGLSGPEQVVTFESIQNDGSIEFHKYGAAKFAPIPLNANSDASAYSDTVFTLTVAKPKNGVWGDSGHVMVSTNDPEFTKLGMTVEAFREQWYGADAAWITEASTTSGV